MLQDRINALLRHIPVVGPKDDEFDPFADVRPDLYPDEEGDDRVHAEGSQGGVREH